MSMTLNGKRALVAGGSSGIGAAIARLFAANGAHVAVVASSDKFKAQIVLDEIATAGGSAQAFAADISQTGEVDRLVGEVAAALGGVDILVNAAGVFYPTPTGETPEADYDRMMDLNLKGAFYLIGAVVPHMKSAGGGKIVNISSVAGSMGLGGYAVYCAAKAGVDMMTRALAIELAPHDINVNAIAPGNTATPMNEDIRTDPEFKPFLDAMAANTPATRIYSTPEDMAGIALLLASDAGRALHGSIILADEGFSAGM